MTRDISSLPTAIPRPRPTSLLGNGRVVACYIYSSGARFWKRRSKVALPRRCSPPTQIRSTTTTENADNATMSSCGGVMLLLWGLLGRPLVDTRNRFSGWFLLFKTWLIFGCLWISHDLWYWRQSIRKANFSSHLVLNWYDFSNFETRFSIWEMDMSQIQAQIRDLISQNLQIELWGMIW